MKTDIFWTMPRIYVCQFVLRTSVEMIDSWNAYRHVNFLEHIDSFDRILQSNVLRGRHDHSTYTM